MENTQHLHQQIERATTRLAQLKARDLLSRQRAQTREQQAKRRAEARRKVELGGLVIAAGAAELQDTEIVGALLSYIGDIDDPAHRERHKLQGAAHLAHRDAACSRARLH